MLFKILFAFLALPISLSLNNAIADRDFKQAIEFQSELIDKLPQTEKGDGLQELAFLYLKDQNQEKAFSVFLSSLDQIQTKEAPVLDAELYQEAFTLYMHPHQQSPQETANKILSMLLPILKDNPNQYLLDYFAAIAYANLGKYDEFFKHFAKAYQHYPNHYLAFKVKAILHIKLLERTRQERERLAQRQMIVKNLLLALDRESRDYTIYKLLISFAPPERKKEQVRLCLNKIVNDNIMIPRSELMFYVIEAGEANEWELAEQFTSKANEWYPQSRIISAARKYLDAHK